MPCVSVVAISPNAHFTLLCTSTLYTDIFTSSINNPLFNPYCLCFCCIKWPSKT
ncbi:hypothetical protein CSPAE12_04847 [Colletotrichum incanum]|nr:hypothetical protein CSPAE12_04847 [Colletotrichum incanum]